MHVSRASIVSLSLPIGSRGFPPIITRNDRGGGGGGGLSIGSSGSVAKANAKKHFSAIVGSPATQLRGPCNLTRPSPSRGPPRSSVIGLFQSLSPLSEIVFCPVPCLRPRGPAEMWIILRRSRERAWLLSFAQGEPSNPISTSGPPMHRDGGCNQRIGMFFSKRRILLLSARSSLRKGISLT